MTTSESEGFSGFDEDSMNKIPINAAMSSWDKGTVILVKVEKIELFSDPVGLSRAIERSPFHKIKMKVIRTNKKKRTNCL